MFPDIDRVLIPQDRIAARVAELGQRLAADLRAEMAARGQAADEPGRVVILPVLTGSIMFVADLVRHVPMMMSMELVAVSSYPGATVESRGARLHGDLPEDLEGRHVVIVDDILDTGRTLGLLRRLVLVRNPASLRICVLLRKAKTPDEPVHADYIGFEIPDEFVVGYGLDYDGFYRNYPQIAVLKGIGP
jgi:hypoxanthine phosphoribosyltransferase